MARKKVSSNKNSSQKKSATLEKEKQREAKAEAEILLHEKLQALMDVNDEPVETIDHFLDTFYQKATKEGRIVPNWRRS